MRRDPFQAIADPTRRAIIAMIARRPMNLNAVASHFQVSRPAISKHMRILTECGLIRVQQQGRERVCRARLEPLREVSQWVDTYRDFWTGKLDALESYLAGETTAPVKKTAAPKPGKKPGKSQRRAATSKITKRPKKR